MPLGIAQLDFVHQRLLIFEIPYILQSRCCDVGQRFTGKESLMGGYEYIIERQQACQYIVVDDTVRFVFIEVLALLLIYIHYGRTDLFIFQYLDQCIGVDQLSTAGVDDHYAVFHLTDGVVVDQILGLLREGAV